MSYFASESLPTATTSLFSVGTIISTIGYWSIIHTSILCNGWTGKLWSSCYEILSIVYFANYYDKIPRGLKDGIIFHNRVEWKIWCGGILMGNFVWYWTTTIITTNCINFSFHVYNMVNSFLGKKIDKGYNLCWKQHMSIMIWKERRRGELCFTKALY